MRMKKLLAAALACCTALTAFSGTAAFAEGPAGGLTPDLVFDFQCAGSNLITINESALADSDIGLDVRLYIPSNPGVNGISLKLQVNDGEVDANNQFGNYGFTLKDAGFANPYCFDSENAGNPANCFQRMFTDDAMNLSWVYRLSQDANADSSSEEGTTSWDSDVSWAYQRAFAEMTLNIPQGTPAGTYVLDIRREPYVNSVTIGGETEWMGKSTCTCAETDGAVDYKSVPLTVIVAEETTTTEATTTSESTTTTEKTTTSELTTTTEKTTTSELTTTTEKTTTSESTTTTDATTTSELTTSSPIDTTSSSVETNTTESGIATSTEPAETSAAPSETTEGAITVETTDFSQLPPIENKYDGMADGMYLVVGDVSGKPGEKVKVPVYVYNDPGIAGMSLYWYYTDGLKISRIMDGNAYLANTQPSAKTVPISYVFTSSDGKDMEPAKDGAVLCEFTVTIPEDAKDGTVYKFEWVAEGARSIPDSDKISQACNTNGVDMHAKFFPGTVTVNAAGTASPRLNYANYSFTKKGEQVKLAVLGALGTNVVWSSSDESVAKVDENGFVTAEDDTGNCKIQAAVMNGSNELCVLTCAISVGLFGDVDGSGKVDAMDSSLALVGFIEIFNEIKPEERTLTPEQELIGDVDLDGKLTAYDSSMILLYFTQKYSAKIEDTTWYSLIGDPRLPDAP